MRNRESRTKGFTLLEILIALFIFTIISMILVKALHTVINADTGTEKNAVRLRNLQMALLILSRDIEQTLDRPILNASGEVDKSFVGSPSSFQFTHTGVANPTGELRRSSLQRTAYVWQEGALWRQNWVVLDQAPNSQPQNRKFLDHIIDAKFKYLDSEGYFQNNWPPSEEQKNPLPRAVSVDLNILNWGKLSQLYVIPTRGEKPKDAQKEDSPES